MGKSENTLFTRLALAVLLPVALLLSAVTIHYNINQRKAVYESTVGKAEIVLTDVVKAFDNWVTDQMILAKALAADPQLKELLLDPSNTEKYLKGKELLDQVLADNPFYENIGAAVFHGQRKPLTLTTGGESYALPDGSMIISTRDESLLGLGASRNYFTAIAEGKDYYISEAYPSMAKATPIFVISVSVIHDQKVIGALGLAPKMSYFIDRFILQSYFEEGEYIFMADQSGNIISHPDQQLVLTEKGISDTVAHMNRIRKGIFRFEEEYGSQTNLYIAEEYDHHGENQALKWYFIYRKPLKSMFEEIRYITFNSILVILITILVIALLILLISRNSRTIFIESETEKH